VGAADADEQVVRTGNAAEQGTDLDYLDPLHDVCAGRLHWRKVGRALAKASSKDFVCSARDLSELLAVPMDRVGVS
jgi:hypothetical protein